VASLVIQWFHHSSGVFAPEVEDCLDPFTPCLSSLTLGGESKADLPMRELPRRIKVIVVA
jgi:hypothetical protein